MELKSNTRKCLLFLLFIIVTMRMQAQITEYKAHIYKTIKTGEKIQLYPQSDFTDSRSFYYLQLTENAYWYVSTDNVVTIGGAETNRYDNNQNKTFTYPDKSVIIGRTPGSAIVTCQILTRSSTSYSGKKSQVFVELQYHITVSSTNNTKLTIEMTNYPGKRVVKGTSVTLEANEPDADIYYNAGNGWKSGRGSCIAIINGNLKAFAVKKEYVGSDFIEQHFDIINSGDFHALYPDGLDLHFNYVDGNKKTCELYYVTQTIAGDFTIPTMINGYTVVGIASDAFTDCSNMVNITIPESVVSIGESAFSGCTALCKILIPGSVVEFNQRAFEGCISLRSVVIMEGVKEIPWCAFNECSSLEEITIPESLQSIGYQAFFGCRNLKSVVSYIQNPSPIYDNVFDMGSERPRSINLKSSDWEWTSATLYVPKGCKEKYETTSGWMLFKNIVEMSDEPEQTIQGDVNGDGSVNGTDLVALANIILGKQSEMVAADVNGDGAVNGTDIVALCNIILGRTTAAAPKRMAVSAVEAVNDVFNAKTKEGVEMTFMVLDEDTKTCQVGNESSEPIAIDRNTKGVITIPSSVNGYQVTAIGGYSFDSCNGITSVYIPNSVIRIGEGAFQGCSLTTVNIPNSVTTIEDYAFNGCDLLSVTLSDQMEVIGESVFGGCLLANVTIPQGIKKIGVAAFYGCPLTTVIIPNSVTSIESNAFGGNKNLSKIYSLIQSPCGIALNSFSDEIYGKAHLYVPKGCKVSYQSIEGWKNFSNIVEMDNEENPVIPVPSNAPLTIQPFGIKAGETKTMTIDLNNPDDELTLVQFDLHLPKGLSIKTAGGDLDIDMCDRTNWRKHSLEANEVDGAYRFLLYSSSNALISGTEGGLITVTLVADNTFTGGSIVIDNALLVSPEQEETKPARYEYAIGDVTPPTPSTTALAIETLSIKAGETKTMTIDLNNPNDELTLVQFDLHLPKGLSIKTVGGDLDIDMCDRTNWRKHSLEANKVDDAYRFLLYSSSNTLISGTEGGIIKMALVANNTFVGGSIVIDNALLVSPEQKEVTPDRYEYTIASFTSIESLSVSKHNKQIYDLGGQLQRNIQKGLNIVNGKKVFIK